ncbi:uncharacterized protein LOC125804981 [Astyanax mexicanus]|uniref:uncharacterized protein LOC125804981 n=1 Tax=Astyanax mexicanus TaxID=7994 RepID=UPI0020CB20FD|nr:uncharacterized protein LOC125804981 [Astyanax mexicanus]
MDYNRSEVYVHISMSAESFAAVNVPLSAVGILINMFFVVCMVFSPQGAEQLKPLLKVLLGSLVGCNFAIFVCSCLIVFYVFVLWEVILDWITIVVISDLILNVMMYTMMTSVTCCHWMNMFYFCQIVPPQNPFLIWFKKNIRALIYSGLIFNAIFHLFGMSVDVAYAVVRLNFYNADNVSTEMKDEMWNSVIVNRQIKVVDYWTRIFCFLLSVCGMLVSSFATVLYLWRHMKNLEESGISSPRLQRQIKIIITGITVQAVLHFLCSDGILIDEIIAKYFSMAFDWNGYILYTFISLYSFGTTINMGISQSLFRQGAVHVWHQTLNFIFH